MKRILLASVTAAALWSAPSFAADPGVPMEEAPIGFSWTGGYVGVHAGYGWGESTFVDRLDSAGSAWNADGDRFGGNSDGFLGGVQAGYNWQAGSFVYGVEADLGYLDLDGGGVSSLSADTIGKTTGGVYAGLSARLGFAFDRTLIYAKAGGVYSGGKHQIHDDVGNTLRGGSESVGLGYQIGGGVEHAITDRWTVKLEYAYFDFGKERLSPEVTLLPGRLKAFDADLDAHTVKFGVNYKF